MRSWMIFFVAGLVLATLQNELIPLFGCISIALTLIGLSFCKQLRFSIVVSGFLLGFLYTSLWGYWQLNHRLPQELIRSDWQVTGTIRGIPQKNADNVRFVLEVDQLLSITDERVVDPLPRKLRLSWFNPSTELNSGDLFTGLVRLKPPHGLMNPHGFDYERWLFVRGIDATGYVREFQSKKLNKNYSIAKLRQDINQRIYAEHNSERIRALLTALITGEKQSFSDHDWRVLRESGTVHLAVISGLHIGFMAFVGWWLGRLFGVVFRGRLQRVFPYLLALTFTAAYTLVAGAELPAQRAFIMVSVLLLSGWRLFVIGLWDRWWLAMTAVLLFSPLAVWETGFWLSFGAVACLIWCGQIYRLKWQDGIKLQFLLLVGMLPMYLVFFSGFSLVAPIVNLIAIPLISVLVPLQFTDLVMGGPMSSVVDLLAEFFWWLIDFSRSFGWAYIDVTGLSPVILFLALVASVIILLPSGVVPRPLALILVLPLIFGTESKELSNFEARVFDVGQGLAVLIEIENYRLLYDTGPSYRSGGNAFGRAVSPYLKQQGIAQIDHVILSHDDNDHVGGFKQLSQEYAIEELITSFDSAYPYVQCKEGLTWSVKGVSFKFLSGSVGQNDNDKSCVLLVESDTCSLLLPGDIGGAVENRLAIDTPIHWLIASHHGSNSSSTRAFLSHIHPEIIVFSAGYGNPFNHPHPKVINRSRETGAELFSTALNGAVFLRSDPKVGCHSSAFRSEQKRFWRSFQSL